MKKNKILIFDTTLRDGEQSAGASMSIEDKVEIAIKLNEMKTNRNKKYLIGIKTIHP